MFQKLKVYKRYFQRISNNHSKRKQQFEEYKRNELINIWNVQDGILSVDHYSHVEFDGFRYNQPLLEKVLLEKRKRNDNYLNEIFKQSH